MYKHIYSHLHSSNFIYAKESGFLKGHSTVYRFKSIIKIPDYIHVLSSVIYIVSKAFGLVWLRECFINHINIPFVVHVATLKKMLSIISSRVMSTDRFQPIILKPLLHGSEKLS